MEERKRNKPLEILNKYKFVLLAAALGAALLLWPAGPGGPEVQTEASQTGIKAQDARETEAAMEKILAEISGVGRVDVMLTLHSGSELVLAEDAALRYSGSVQSPDNYERSTDTVTTSGGVVVRQEIYPQYRGALVVCDGGNSDRVRLAVIDAVSVLTGLGADRIAVVKWQDAGTPGGTGTAN